MTNLFQCFELVVTISINKCGLYCMLLWLRLKVMPPPDPCMFLSLIIWHPPSPPCSVLLTSWRSGLEASLPAARGQLWREGNRMMKMAVWGLSATLGAAVFAVAQTAMEWGPDLILELFWWGWWEQDRKKCWLLMICRAHLQRKKVSWCQTGYFYSFKRWEN